jgi:hypothetical protein
MAGAEAEGGAGVGAAVRNYIHNTMSSLSELVAACLAGQGTTSSYEKEGAKMDHTVLAAGARAGTWHSRPGNSQMETGS